MLWQLWWPKVVKHIFNYWLALSKVANRVGFSVPSPENGNRSSFRNVTISSVYNSGRWAKSIGLVIVFIEHFETGRYYNLQYIITRILVPKVTSSLPLLCSGFQQQMFPFLWVPELSLNCSRTLATSFSNSNSSQRLNSSSSLIVTEVKVKVTFRPTVSLSVCQSVCLSDKHPTGGQDSICTTVTRRWVSWCRALSMTRGRICRSQLLLVFVSSVNLGSKNRGTRDHILQSQIRDSSNLQDQVLVLLPPNKRIAPRYPQALCSLFVASNCSQGYNECTKSSLHRGNWLPTANWSWSSLISFVFSVLSCCRGNVLVCWTIT
jgi:hypothetical protein